MLFNSYPFIFIFLPITILGFHALNKWSKSHLSYFWLIFASLVFYCCWDLRNLPLLLISIILNFLINKKIQSSEIQNRRKILFIAGLSFNLLLLGYFKYADFVITNINWLFKTQYSPVLSFFPLGLSFFTIQQIAFLIDSYQGISKNYSFTRYSLFVSFFPQLISGPITSHSQIMPQFEIAKKEIFHLEKFKLGLFLFIIGLTKKVLISDQFSQWVNPVFNEIARPDFFASWKASLFYSFQLYFDFSGYTDMAIGCGYFFNIKLPQNFNSPFKSKSVIEFWTRWHITLSQFITTYVFTPIVRSMPKINFKTTMLATLIAMFISGIWHGAGWTYITYGILHGMALVINHWWKKKKIKLPGFLSWVMTFSFIIFSFVVFRAKEINQAFSIWKGMLGLNGFVIPKIGIKSVGILKDYGFKMGTYLYPIDYIVILSLLFCLFHIHFTKSTFQLEKEIKLTTRHGMYCGILFALALLGMNQISEFIYLNF